MDWQPIETAPRDGTKIDLWMNIPASALSMGWADAFRVADCWFDGGWLHIHLGRSKALNESYITHWVPLPAPPKEAP